MKLIGIIILFLLPTFSYAVVPQSVMSATDVMLYENYGMDAGYDYPKITVADGDTSRTEISLNSNYMLRGIGVYTTKNVTIRYTGILIDCINGINHFTNSFNPENNFVYWPFTNVTAVTIINNSGSACDAYIYVRAKHK